MNEGKMFKSKFSGSIQEVILPDFPDDDTTITTTTTRSRRVSFGTNLVKEFIVGSAVSAQCVSEYEQAFSSSDSSNANSSHSLLNSGILGQSTFTVENFKHSVGQNTFTIENHKDQVRQSTFTIENQKENIRQNTFNLEKQNEHFSVAGKTFCEFDPNENHPKRPRFSRTICFNVDSPTADMEFTEGCLTLAKTILDKKNKDMRVIIQAESKEEEKIDKNESIKHFGSHHDMNLTQCVTGKENRRNKNFQGEKSKIFNSLNDDTENCTLFGKKLPSNISESTLNDSLKENQMPLDLIMQQLDKNNSDSEDFLYPEKTLTAALNASIFDSDEKDDKLSLNESMDISLDFPPQRVTSIEGEGQIMHLSNTDEFDKQLLIENQLPVVELNNLDDKEVSVGKEDSFLEEVEKDINTELAKGTGEEDMEISLREVQETEKVDISFDKVKESEEMEISLGKVQETDVTQEKMDLLKQKQALDVRLKRKDSSFEEQVSRITQNHTNKLEFHEEIDYLEKVKEKTDVKEKVPDSREIFIAVKESTNNEIKRKSFTSETEESKNVSNLNKSNLLTAEEVVDEEPCLDELRKDENEILIECNNDEKGEQANKIKKEVIKGSSIIGVDMTDDPTSEKMAEIVSELPLIDSKVIEDQHTEEIEEFNKEPSIISENKSTEDQSEKVEGINKKESFIDCTIVPSQPEEFEEIITHPSTISGKVVEEQGLEKIQEISMKLQLIDGEIAQNKISKNFEDTMSETPIIENKVVEDKFEKKPSEPPLLESKVVDLPIEESDEIIKEPSIVSGKMIEDQLSGKVEKITVEAKLLSDRMMEDQPIEKNKFEEIAIESVMADSRLIDQPIGEPESLITDGRIIEDQSIANIEEITSDLPLVAISSVKNQENEEFEEVIMELPLVDNKTHETERMEKPEGIILGSKLGDSSIVEDQIMEEFEEITREPPLVDKSVEEDQKIEDFEEIIMEPPLVDCRVIHDLKTQSEESNCLWTLKNWKYNGRDNSGVWNFNFKLLESYSTLTFHLMVREGENMVSQGVYKSSCVHLNEEDEHRRKEYYPTLNFGYLHQKEYLEENQKMVKTVRQIPYFLDLMNSYMIKVNSYLSQIYSILTLYPGSSIENSILTFRLFSFPIFFSCNVSVNLSDLYELSKSSVSFEYDFGSFDENKIQDIFEECLKSKNSLSEFIIGSTKYLIDIEKKSGRVSKRTYLRLLPPEIRY